MAKIKLQQGNTVANIFAEFISAKRAKGLVNKTIHSTMLSFVLVLKNIFSCGIIGKSAKTRRGNE